MRRLTLVALLTMLPALSDAELITVITEGVFTEYDDPQGLLPFSEPVSGSLFSISFTYDSSTPDSVEPFPFLGEYIGAIISIELTIPSNSFGMLDTGDIFVANEAISPFDLISQRDAWVAETSTVLPAGQLDGLTQRFGLALTADAPVSPVLALDSDDLVQPEWPDSWDNGEIFFAVDQTVSGTTTQISVASAEVNSLTVVPIPAAFWLFYSGLVGALAWMRRHRA